MNLPPNFRVTSSMSDDPKHMKSPIHPLDRSMLMIVIAVFIYITQDWSLFYSFIIPIIHNLPSNFISFQVVHWCQVDSIPKLRFPTKIQRSRLSPGKWRIVHQGKRASNGFAEARDRKISSPNQRIVFVPCINLYIFFKSNIYIYNYIYTIYIYNLDICM